MKTNEPHVPILDFLYRKPILNTLALPEVLDVMEDPAWDIYNDLQTSNIRLSEHIAALREQNEDLRIYASTVAHDLKGPLCALLITADLINNTPRLTNAELKNYLKQITSTARQMNAIISALLLFAKVSNTEALIERVDMDCAVANVLDRLSYLIEEHHAQIDTPESWPAAIGYTPWLEEVWANYIINALKHGGRSPRVELGASPQPEDGMIRFWARDNGPGIPADAQAQLFTPFNQISSVDASGDGLGLSIVFRIVEKLGGQVGVESEIGKGSQFFFTLPAISPADKT